MFWFLAFVLFLLIYPTDSFSASACSFTSIYRFKLFPLCDSRSYRRIHAGFLVGNNGNKAIRFFSLEGLVHKLPVLCYINCANLDVKISFSYILWALFIWYFVLLIVILIINKWSPDLLLPTAEYICFCVCWNNFDGSLWCHAWMEWNFNNSKG